MIIGGAAASLLGTPHYTVDLDAVLLLDFEDIPILLLEAAKVGIQPRIWVEKFGEALHLPDLWKDIEKLL